MAEQDAHPCGGGAKRRMRWAERLSNLSAQSCNSTIQNPCLSVSSNLRICHAFLQPIFFSSSWPAENPEVWSLDALRGAFDRRAFFLPVLATNLWCQKQSLQ